MLIGFIIVLAGIVALLVPSIASEFEDLGPTIEDAIDDVENWLVEDSPFDVSRQDVQDFRDEADERVGDVLESQSGTLISGTILVFEVFAGIVLALVTTFFILKDGDRFGDWFVARFPHHRRDLAGRLGARAWRTLGGYLRGSATLGLIEGIIIGGTVWLVGGSLALPVGVITFFAAFVPFAGALIAGVIAILVTLVTAGFGGAVVVAIVALVVQQLDNDFLAPWVFGRNLELHPLIVLVAITAGGTLFGAFGAFLAVPVSAVLINILAESRVVPEELAVDGPAGEPGADDPGARVVRRSVLSRRRGGSAGQDQQGRPTRRPGSGAYRGLHREAPAADATDEAVAQALQQGDLGVQPGAPRRGEAVPVVCWFGVRLSGNVAGT